MHTGRDRVRDPDVIVDQGNYLTESIKVLKAAGIADEAIVLDPGFGFAKDPHENVQLLARIRGIAQVWLSVACRNIKEAVYRTLHRT